MRIKQFLGLVIVTLVAGSAVAEQSAVQERKIKTGILPTGGFYSLYEVTCADNSTAAVASIDRRSRWCTLDGAELTCFRGAQRARDRACAYRELAANDIGAPTGIEGREVSLP